MTMVATAVHTVLHTVIDIPEGALPFVPALLSKNGTTQVFDLRYDGEPLDGVDANCQHGTKYVGRFGDLCCTECHLPLAFSPNWVKAGLYGSPKDTFSWIQGVVNRHLKEVDVVDGVMLHKMWSNYDLLSEHLIDMAYASDRYDV